MAIPVCLSTVGIYQSSVLSSPASSSMTGCRACDKLRTLSRVDCAISRTSCKSARSGDPSGTWFPAQRGLPRLQGELNVGARLFIFSIVSERENTVHSVPELSKLAREKGALLGRAARREARLDMHGVVQVGANALELRRPCRQRIGLVIADHVAHGHRQQVQIV